MSVIEGRKRGGYRLGVQRGLVALELKSQKYCAGEAVFHTGEHAGGFCDGVLGRRRVIAFATETRGLI